MSEVINLCLCGCGQSVKSGKRFCQGHNIRLDNPIKRPDVYKRYLQTRPDTTGENNPFYGKHHTEEWRRKKSIQMKRYAKNNPNFGMRGKLHSEETKKKLKRARNSEGAREHMSRVMKGRTPSPLAGKGIYSSCKKGHCVRSSWERRVADWLWNNSIEYQYEPERFIFNKRISYLPDFYLPQNDLYIEVKGYMTSKNKIQHKLFEKKGCNLLVIDKIDDNNIGEKLRWLLLE